MFYFKLLWNSAIDCVNGNKSLLEWEWVRILKRREPYPKFFKEGGNLAWAFFRSNQICPCNSLLLVAEISWSLISLFDFWFWVEGPVTWWAFATLSMVIWQLLKFNFIEVIFRQPELHWFGWNLNKFDLFDWNYYIKIYILGNKFVLQLRRIKSYWSPGNCFLRWNYFVLCEKNKSEIRCYFRCYI